MSTNEKPHEAPFEAARPEETLPLLQSAVVRNSRLQCWSPGQKHSYVSRIVKLNETGGLVSLSISKEEPGGDEFENALLASSLEEMLFSLHLPTDVIFFKGELRRGESGYITARLKPPIFKVQRRESMRLTVTGSAPTIAKITLPSGEELDTKLVNFSDGGASVTVPGKEIFERLNAEKPLVSIIFEVHGIEVKAIALVRHGFETNSSFSGKTYRIGIEYATIDPKLKTRLSQLVFEESTKFYGRV